VEVHLGKITEINLREKWLGGAGVELGFDYLVIACGAQHSYFGHGEWEPFAPGLKTVEQATEIRRRILSAFESAENELEPAKQEALLNFVIVGGGPTGVELAGAIADISRDVIVRDFRRINPAQAKIILIEAGPRVLASFSERLSHRAHKDLEKLGVIVRTHSRVSQIDAAGVMVNSDRIASKTVIWAAGVQASPISRSLGINLDKAGRIPVNADLSLPGHPDIFAAGDIAQLEIDGQPVPGLAPAAIQAGRKAAENILASIHSRPREPFRYFDKGQMATIGKWKAVAQVKKFRFGGYLAWLAWIFIHLIYLVGFKNRVAVLANWGWSYLFSKRGSRLITNPDWTQENRT
jgi:NADH dehydrogenase